QDLLQLEQIDRVRIAPDGGLIAIGRLRSRVDGESPRLSFLGRLYAGDIWIADSKGSPLINITQGAKDGAGFWWPSWSPDSRWLAMFSTRGGDVAIWVWNRSSGELKRVISNRATEPWADQIAWVSDHELAIVALPPGERSAVYEIDRNTRES